MIYLYIYQYQVSFVICILLATYLIGVPKKAMFGAIKADKWFIIIATIVAPVTMILFIYIAIVETKKTRKYLKRRKKK